MFNVKKLPLLLSAATFHVANSTGVSM